MEDNSSLPSSSPSSTPSKRSDSSDRRRRISALIIPRRRSSFCEYTYEGNGDSAEQAIQTAQENQIRSPAELAETNAKLKNTIMKLNVEVQDLKSDLNSYEETTEQLAQQKANLNRKVTTYKEKLELSTGQFTHELQAAKEQIAAWEQRDSRRAIQMRSMEREKVKFLEQHEQLKNELNSARAETEIYRRRSRDLEVELKRSVGLEVELMDVLALQEEKDNEIKSLHKVIEELREFNESIKQEKAELEIKCSSLSIFQPEGETLNASFRSMTSLLSEPDFDDDSSFEGISGISNPFGSSPYWNKSIRDEINETLGHSEPCSLSVLNRSECVASETQTEEIVNPDPSDPKAGVDINKLLVEIWKVLKIANKHGDCDGMALDICPREERGEGDARAPDIDHVQEEIVRRINEELADFREQLKKSQELFQNASATSQNFAVTQSCPLLAADDAKPAMTTSSTQTDHHYNVMQSDRSSLYYPSPMPPPDAIDDSEFANIYENLSLDDGGSYRLAINLTTVVEETSDQETDTSPSSMKKRMNSDKRNRPKLTKMPNAMDDEHDKMMDAEDVKSSDEYQSAQSSLPASSNTSNYGSMERPLHFGNLQVTNGAKEDDTCSSRSGRSTTYGSPVSSPSSMAYWTPLEGSSSQDTITIPDGDKTPVNDELGALEHDSYLDDNNRPKSSSWGPDLPLDRPNNHSIGVIPDCDLPRMQQNAVDAVLRACDPAAAVLPNSEWRTLNRDLNAKEMDLFKKENRQEEGGDPEEGGFPRGSSSNDLDEEAEEYCEIYPQLIEQLFKSLDDLKDKPMPSEAEVESVSAQFEQLSVVFKSNHINLQSRSELVQKKHEYSQRRLKEIFSSWKENLRKLHDQKSVDFLDILSGMEDSSQELETHANSVSTTARLAGMMDFDIRAYKMIEVMILYVHILKTLRETEEDERQTARRLLVEHNIPLPPKRVMGHLQNNNNNINKVTLREGILGEGEATDRREDGTPTHRLQYLLARKSPSETAQSSKEHALPKDKGASQGRLIKYWSEFYQSCRRELHWPWSWDQTWTGIKQGFSIFIMLIGILIIVGNVIPNVGVGAKTECRLLTDFFAVFSRYGSLTHENVPHL